MAVVIDWLLCVLIAYALFQVPWGAGGTDAFIPLAIFAVENLVLVSTLGSTLGHRIMGLQVYRLVPTPIRTPQGMSRLAGSPGVAKGALRTLLLCLFVPALVPNTDNRGLHDQAAGTVIVRTR